MAWRGAAHKRIMMFLSHKSSTKHGIIRPAVLFLAWIKGWVHAHSARRRGALLDVVQRSEYTFSKARFDRLFVWIVQAMPPYAPTRKAHGALFMRHYLDNSPKHSLADWIFEKMYPSNI